MRGIALAAALVAAPVACTLSGLDGLSGGAPDASPSSTSSPAGGGHDARAPNVDAAANAADAPSARTPSDDYRDAVLVDHPVAYYRLGDTGPTAKDEMGAHDGTYVGKPSPAGGAMTGDSAGALHGDGTVYIDIGDPFPFTGNASYSIEAWVAPAVTPTLVGVVGRNLANGGSPVDGYSLYLDGLAPTMGRWFSSNEQSAASAPLEAGQYRYVVGTYDGATLRVYVDAGSPTTGNASHAIIAAAVHVTIAATRNGTYGYFQGSIDEVAIYDYELPAARIVAHHAASGR